MYLRIDERDADRTAIVEHGGGSYTYGDLCRFTETFREMVPSRTLIFILCRNCAATIAAHIACIQDRIVPLMISSRMDGALRDRLIETYMPAYLWLPEEMAPTFPAMDIAARQWGYALLKTGYTAPALHEELAMLLTTSGSTGSPKLIRHRYRNLYANAENVAALFAFTEADRPLIDLQLHYTMGLNVACSSLYAGATLCMTTKNAAQLDYWTFFKEQRITNITGVPYNYEILKRLKFFRSDWPDLRILAEGGGRLTDELFREVATYAREKGKRFYATFGTSETTARLAYLDPAYALERTGSIGKAIPHGKLSLIDEDGNEILEREATGELVYAGENVTMGYATQPADLMRGDDWHGVYRTGDLARRDGDGFYYIIGRRSRFLKLYGYRVGLDESERLIRERFEIECACVGDDRQMRIYTTTPGLEADIKKFISEKTGIFPAAFSVQTIREIPKNEVGKILHSKL